MTRHSRILFPAISKWRLLVGQVADLSAGHGQVSDLSYLGVADYPQRVEVQVPDRSNHREPAARSKGERGTARRPSKVPDTSALLPAHPHKKSDNNRRFISRFTRRTTARCVFPAFFAG